MPRTGIVHFDYHHPGTYPVILYLVQRIARMNVDCCTRQQQLSRWYTQKNSLWVATKDQSAVVGVAMVSSTILHSTRHDYKVQRLPKPVVSWIAFTSPLLLLTVLSSATILSSASTMTHPFIYIIRNQNKIVSLQPVKNTIDSGS